MHMGLFLEVTAAGQTVWEYEVPVDPSGPLTQGSHSDQRRAGRALRYDASYPGLAGKTLTPAGYIEQ